MLLFALVASALTWMHFAIRRMERARTPELSHLPELPEMSGLHPSPSSGHVPVAPAPVAAAG
jgi:NNP family nitrate/nitrite transporter-like MFS transporter